MRYVPIWLTGHVGRKMVTMSRKRKQEKHPSNSDKVVEYLRTRWSVGQWGLDNIAQHLFPDFDSVSGPVRDAYRRSSMNAFNGARAKLIDLYKELVIPMTHFKGSQKVASWSFATNSEEHREKIEKLLLRKEGMANGFNAGFARVKQLVHDRGWLGQSAVSAIN